MQKHTAAMWTSLSKGLEDHYDSLKHTSPNQTVKVCHMVFMEAYVAGFRHITSSKFYTKHKEDQPGGRVGVAPYLWVLTSQHINYTSWCLLINCLYNEDHITERNYHYGYITSTWPLSVYYTMNIWWVAENGRTWFQTRSHWLKIHGSRYTVNAKYAQQ